MTKKTNNTLLIWEGFENGAKLYLIPDAPEWLDRCHRHLVNEVCDEEVEELLFRVSDALCEDPEHYSNSKDSLAGAWVAHMLDPNEVVEVGPVRVVCTGFII